MKILLVFWLWFVFLVDAAFDANLRSDLSVQRKKGVEFKCYAEHRLPHAKVVAIESDREFALSVLQRVDDELKRRGDMFRKLGVQDIAGYKRAGGTEPMPRSLLLIDEFQEFFVDDDGTLSGPMLAEARRMIGVVRRAVRTSITGSACRATRISNSRWSWIMRIGRSAI